MISYTWAIKCHKCDGLIDCAQATIGSVNCNSDSEKSPAEPDDADMCGIKWAGISIAKLFRIL